MDDIRHKIPTPPVRFLDLFRLDIRQQGLAYQTEKTYVHWIKRFIFFHNKRHPKDMGAAEIEVFLSHLSIHKNCSINTQRIALNALIYLYKRFMGLDIGELSFTPATAPRRLPVVYSREEISAILRFLPPTPHLMVELMYGSGLRSAELLSLRIKDIDFAGYNVLVRAGKGNKDRSTLLPKRLIKPLKHQVSIVESLHRHDLQAGFGEVYLPDALSRKYPDASQQTAWQFLGTSD
ncbi:phage integrase N-terminal SAM-like domain-containing protein [Aestuariirhabdus sp. Z084]|uniref:phage integrase N-terminal SAM-like domain-containing protein n=1 Tax=Aestuariirhabdus haliotis TaxID=2918751 RepID=UPI00201B3B51|nr:phage integrase N-terminal SAM-like domain-containing protein [Aestuariirhabdus haliotis]MCL6417734.1 phage integrase N-terminal SAM-like domain-containing protein [Aestuariirhabdus haliotis]MCL6421661.1 phage integrase N-terminal SAM-like domain-containing protein [Aestuariirhabdus haliotis]